MNYLALTKEGFIFIKAESKTVAKRIIKSKYKENTIWITNNFNKQNNPMELTLKNEQAQFEALKQQSISIAEQCQKLQVTDETTKAIATQNLSKALSVTKQIEEIRVKNKKPYKDAGDQIDALAKSLSKPITDSINIGKQNILAYDKVLRDKADKEAERIRIIKTMIQVYSNSAIAKMDACKTYDELKEARTEWIVNAPKDKWSEFLPQFEASLLTLNEYAKSRKIGFLTPEQSDPEEAAIIAETVIEEVSNIGAVEIAATFVPKLSGSRKTWTHELLDITQIPAEWMMLDDAIVKKWMADNKDKLTDGKELEFQGVRFFQRESLTIR